MSVVTTCTMDCPDRCSIRCRVEAGGIRLRGNPDHPYTRGFTCAKIRRHPGRLASPHRIREPWVRDGDRFRPTSWDEALDRVCEALERARADDPATIFQLRGAGSMGLSKTAVDYLFASLGARGVTGSLCDGAGIEAIVADAGRLDMNHPSQLDRAEGIVLWGKNPRASSIHVAAQVSRARRRGVPVIAVNPDGRGLGGLADRVIRIRPGTDRFLAAAVLCRLLDDPPRPIPWDRAHDPDRFRAMIRSLGPADLLGRCGIGPEAVDALATLYGASPRTATVIGWGVQRYAYGAETVRGIHAVAFVTGTLGVEGGGFYYNISSRHGLTPPRPDTPRPTPLCVADLGRELPRSAPPVNIAWISGSNVMNQAPDTKAVARGFAGVGTVVVTDAFWTETAHRAHVVLPTTLWLEEDDLVGPYWRKEVGAVRRVVDPPPECRTDFDLAVTLSERLGVPLPHTDRDEWLQACLPPDGPTLAEVRRDHWRPLPGPTVVWTDGFGHADGRFRFFKRLTDEKPDDPRHPLGFLTLVRRDRLHSQTLPEEQTGSLPVRVHPDTARALDLGPGDQVRVVSRVGELEGEIHLDPDLHPEAVACPRGGWIRLGHGVNEAVVAGLADHGGQAAYYSTRVRLERTRPTNS